MTRFDTQSSVAKRADRVVIAQANITDDQWSSVIFNCLTNRWVLLYRTTEQAQARRQRKKVDNSLFRSKGYCETKANTTVARDS